MKYFVKFLKYNLTYFHHSVISPRLGWENLYDPNTIRFYVNI
jgi:hypothetical protein